MARMIRERLPAGVGSNAERRVYDPYTVLYDVAWLDYGAHKGTQ